MLVVVQAPVSPPSVGHRVLKGGTSVSWRRAFSGSRVQPPCRGCGKWAGGGSVLDTLLGPEGSAVVVASRMGGGGGAVPLRPAGFLVSHRGFGGWALHLVRTARSPGFGWVWLAPELVWGPPVC